ncbi:polyprenyl synthetase family protein [Streptomyces sp. NPDC059928]|uniref:polyprenyl synthetase family protein n=1 Tax=unclassified Streptomyces TaxID=2593676 RepID=UPI00364920B0
MGSLPADVAERADRRLHEALVRPVRYLVEAGGARLRPRLLLAAIDLLGGDVARYAPLAAAMELMHTGSLMVDDVQDGATLRRGRAPSHAVFGQATALNAGTAAYFTFDHALRSTLPEDAALRAAVTETCLGVLRSAHAGQGLDLEGHQAEMDAAVAAGCGREVQHLVRLTHRLKSGAPVRACMETAALLTGAGKDVQAALGAFGEAVGVSYQIIDDVLDLDGVVRGGSATKRAGEDLFNGKVTMPMAHAVDLLPQARMAPLWNGLRDGRAGKRRVVKAAQVLRGCGALEASRTEAFTKLRREWERVEDFIEDSPKTRALWTLAHQAVSESRRGLLAMGHEPEGP